MTKSERDILLCITTLHRKCINVSTKYEYDTITITTIHGLVTMFVTKSTSLKWHWYVSAYHISPDIPLNSNVQEAIKFIQDNGT